MSLIEVKNIVKDFKVFKRKKGFFNSMISLFFRKTEIKRAVDDISFSIDKGELVGYIGPNGAGKSTTIKILCGILLPTSGKVTINNFIPYEQRMENAMQIGVVFGQRSQLYWDLPVEDTFELHKKMYRLSDDRYKRNLKFFIELLEMHEFIKRQARQLSLGEKMRANIALSLLHDPLIVYLDEPTIGLDIVATKKIRHFIKEINQEKKVTLILTTHNMDDIEEICSRLIMIDHGRKLYDGSLEQFKRMHSDETLIIADFEKEKIVLNDPRLVIAKEDGVRKWISFKKENIALPEAISYLLSNFKIYDLKIKEADVEDIVRDLYENKRQYGSR
jgi:ABC-2 type transport system ATP-binding protein